MRIAHLEIKTKNKGNNFLFKVLAVLLIVFVVLQLYILTAVGAKGEALNTIRQQQSQLKIENDIKKAQILKIKSSPYIAQTIESLQMQQVRVNYIDSELVQIAAQSP